MYLPGDPTPSAQEDKLMTRLWRIAAIFRCFLIATLLIDCFSFATAQAQKSGPVRLGIAGISGSSVHAFVTKQLNLFSKYGVDVEPVVFQGGIQMTQALFSGDLPLGLIDGVPVLSANLAGANLVFIAGNINTFPYTILGRSELRSATDLKGRKIGISRYGSVSDMATRLALERSNLKPDKEVAILQIGGQSDRFAALRAGLIDATIVSPPFNLVARRLGFKELIDISETGAPYPHLHVAARRDFLERFPDQALRFLKGMIEGTSYWKDPAKKEIVMRNVARVLKLDPEKDREQLDETFRYYGKLFPARPYPSLEGMEYALELLQKSRPEAKNLHAKDYIVNRFIDELQKENFLTPLFRNP
jgi:ABC-type nitrate/sulfonate/bicarbonate transport system substrate-binding protein